MLNFFRKGDGDQGPPDGWCYEGFHTTDVKRARFRADSTPQDDKLISCRRMRCFQQDGLAEGRERTRRAAAQKSLKEESDEEEDYDEKELEREAAALEGVKWQRKKSIGHHVRRSDASAMEVELNEEQSTVDRPKSTPRERDGQVEKSVKPKAKSAKADNMKAKSVAAKSKTSAASPVPDILNLPVTDSNGDSAMDALANQDVESKPKPKKPRKSRKSTDGGKYIPPKDEEESTDDEEEDRPKRKKRKST